MRSGSTADWAPAASGQLVGHGLLSGPHPEGIPDKQCRIPVLEPVLGARRVVVSRIGFDEDLAPRIPRFSAGPYFMSRGCSFRCGVAPCPR